MGYDSDDVRRANVGDAMLGSRFVHEACTRDLHLVREHILDGVRLNHEVRRRSGKRLPSTGHPSRRIFLFAKKKLRRAGTCQRSPQRWRNRRSRRLRSGGARRVRHRDAGAPRSSQRGRARFRDRSRCRATRALCRDEPRAEVFEERGRRRRSSQRTTAACVSRARSRVDAYVDQGAGPVHQHPSRREEHESPGTARNTFRRRRSRHEMG